MASEVEMDRKGRVLIPIRLRKKLGANRLRIVVEGKRIVLEAMEGPEQVLGKYRGLFGKKTIAEIEEEEEEFLFKERGIRERG